MLIIYLNKFLRYIYIVQNLFKIIHGHTKSLYGMYIIIVNRRLAVAEFHKQLILIKNCVYFQ